MTSLKPPKGVLPDSASTDLIIGTLLAPISHHGDYNQRCQHVGVEEDGLPSDYTCRKLVD